MNTDQLKRVSFSLYALLAEHFPKTNSQRQKLVPGVDASAIQGRAGRSGCTPAEPYPPSREPIVQNQKKKKTIYPVPVDKPHTRLVAASRA